MSVLGSRVNVFTAHSLTDRSYDQICFPYSCLILIIGNPSLSKKCIQDFFLPSKYKLLAKIFLLWTKNPSSLQCKILYHQISSHFCCTILLSNVSFCAVFQTFSKLMTCLKFITPLSLFVLNHNSRYSEICLNWTKRNALILPHHQLFHHRCSLF